MLFISTGAKAAELDIKWITDDVDDTKLVFPDVFRLSCEYGPEYISVQWNPSPIPDTNLTLSATITGNSAEFRFKLIEAGPGGVSDDGCNCNAEGDSCDLEPEGKCFIEAFYYPQHKGIKKKKLNFDGIYTVSDSVFDVSETFPVFATSYPSNHPAYDPYQCDG